MPEPEPEPEPEPVPEPNIRGRKILRFFYFEIFTGGNYCGFLTQEKRGLVDGNKFAG